MVLSARSCSVLSGRYAIGTLLPTLRYNNHSFTVNFARSSGTMRPAQVARREWAVTPSPISREWALFTLLEFSYFIKITNLRKNEKNIKKISLSQILTIFNFYIFFNPHIIIYRYSNHHPFFLHKKYISLIFLFKIFICIFNSYMSRGRDETDQTKRFSKLP